MNLSIHLNNSILNRRLSVCHHTSVEYGPCYDKKFRCKYKTKLEDYQVTGRGTKDGCAMEIAMPKASGLGEDERKMVAAIPPPANIPAIPPDKHAFPLLSSTFLCLSIKRCQ